MPTANYKVKAKRIQPGEYRLSYGRGKKKRTCTVYVQSDGWWQTIPAVNDTGPTYGIGPCVSLKEIKRQWGEVAAENYEAGAEERPQPKEYDDWIDVFHKYGFERLCETYGTAFITTKAAEYAEKEGI